MNVNLPAPVPFTLLARHQNLQFYLLICILVAINDGLGKQFMYRHWRTCFEILDEDGSKAVSRTEFETLGFLFNFSRKAVRKIYEEFDVSGNQVCFQARHFSRLVPWEITVFKWIHAHSLFIILKIIRRWCIRIPPCRVSNPLPGKLTHTRRNWTTTNSGYLFSQPWTCRRI